MALRARHAHYHVIETVQNRLPDGEPRIFSNLEDAKRYLSDHAARVSEGYVAADREEPLLYEDGDLCVHVVSVRPPRIDRTIRISPCTDTGCRVP